VAGVDDEEEVRSSIRSDIIVKKPCEREKEKGKRERGGGRGTKMRQSVKVKKGERERGYYFVNIGLHIYVYIQRMYERFSLARSHVLCFGLL
jgi:hypothetical protein